VTVGYAIYSGTLALAIGTFFTFHVSNPGHVLTLPNSAKFWEYLVNFLSAGLSMETSNLPMNLFGVMIVVLPVLLFIPRLLSNLRERNDVWIYLLSLAGIISIAGIIAVGRANFGVGQAKSSRYYEISCMLVPITVWGYAIALEQFRPNIKKSIFILFWIFCGCLFFPDWSYRRHYQPFQVMRIEGEACIRRYYAGEGKADCPHIYPLNISSALDYAKELNLGIYTDNRPTP
jgi:hypothetical protein